MLQDRKKIRIEINAWLRSNHVCVGLTHLGILLGQLPELDAGGPRVAEDLQEFQLSRGHSIT